MPPSYLPIAGYSGLKLLARASGNLAAPVMTAGRLMFELSSLSCALGPLCSAVGFVLLLKNPWRSERPRPERAWLALAVVGSVVAWFVSFFLFNDILQTLR